MVGGKRGKKVSSLPGEIMRRSELTVTKCRTLREPFPKFLTKEKKKERRIYDGFVDKNTLETVSIRNVKYLFIVYW